MKIRLIFLARVPLVLLLLSTLALGGRQPAAAQARTGAAAPAALDPSALLFIENTGQFAAGARFQARGPGWILWLAEDALWLTLAGPPAADSATVKLSFPGGNPHPRPEPFDRAATRVSFFTGSDPAKWRASVPVWGGVRYVDLYPGIDLEITGEQGQLSPRLAARPGADLSVVRLRVEGADVVTIAGDALQLTTAAGQFAWPLLRAQDPTATPSVWTLGNQSFEVTAPFAPAGPPPSVPTAPADDPADLLYGTFLGGANSDVAYGLAVDADRASYLTGQTWSTDFPSTPGAFDPSFNYAICGFEVCSDAFIVKLSADGSTLDYATFLGGLDEEGGRAVAVDADGAAYVTGHTGSADFPTTPGAFDTSCGADGACDNYSGDAFVAKLSADGSALVYATFLGGGSSENGYGLAVDDSGGAYVTGDTTSADFPTTAGAFDTILDGYSDAYVVRLNAAGSALDYSTFLGGTGPDNGQGIALDGSGAAHVTGGTSSSDFPTTPGAFDTSHNGEQDAFVARLNAAGSALDYSTFLGGSSYETALSIALDASGAAYVAGQTSSSDLPVTPGAFDTTYNGGVWPAFLDAFAARLSADGSALGYATYLGGSNDEGAQGVALDGDAALVVGFTRSADLPTTPGAFDTTYNGDDEIGDAFALRINADGSALDYGTFLGGVGPAGDSAEAVALDASGAVHIAGSAGASDFPTTPGAFDTTYNGGYSDVFVVRMEMQAVPTYSISGRVTGGCGQAIPGVTISATGGLSAVTDDEGDYVIASVVSGTYTLTPTLAGYAFDPPARTVQVPPDAAGQDFSGTPGGGAAGLLYGTFLGGSGSEWGYDVAVDGGGAAYVTGYTASSDFPTTPGAFDTSFNGDVYDAFVAKLSADGSALDYATFLGGTANDYGNGIAVDGDGAAYIAGSTSSADFPTTPGAFDTSFADVNDVVVVKLSPDGSTLEYSTYLGSTNSEVGYAIAVDDDGAAYVTGDTDSSYFPTTPGAFDPTYDGWGDAFVVKLNAGGSALDYGTFLGGGTNPDGGNGIAVDGSGAAYVAGTTLSSDFPTTPDAFDTSYNGSDDAFVAKLSADGSALDYGTFLGGSGGDVGENVAIHGSGAAYAAISTWSDDMPTTANAFDTSLDGYYDAFVARLSAGGSTLDYGTYLGGTGSDLPGDIAVDEDGAAYVTGLTESSDFPTTLDGFDTSFNGGGGGFWFSDAFVAKLNAGGSALDYGTFLGGTSSEYAFGIAVDGRKAAYVAGVTWSDDLPTTPGAFDTSFNGGEEDAFVLALGTEAGPTYCIAGEVTDTGGLGMPGVTISAGPGGSAVTGEDGDYVIANVVSGTYTLTPTLAGYVFDPITRTVAVPPDAVDQDFVAALLTYSIGGRVADEDGDPLPGVTISASGGFSAVTAADGVYTITGLLSGTFTFTPTLAGYAFDPPTRTVAVPPDAVDQDFVAALLTYSIGGRVADEDGDPLPGVTVSASGGFSAVTGASGVYTITGLLPGAYTLTPALDGYSFDPPTRTVAVPPDAVDQDFVAAPPHVSVYLPLIVRGP